MKGSYIILIVDRNDFALKANHNVLFILIRNAQIYLNFLKEDHNVVNVNMFRMKPHPS